MVDEKRCLHAEKDQKSKKKTLKFDMPWKEIEATIPLRVVVGTLLLFDEAPSISRERILKVLYFWFNKTSLFITKISRQTQKTHEGKDQKKTSAGGTIFACVPRQY